LTINCLKSAVMMKFFVLCLIIIINSGCKTISQSNKEASKEKEITLSLDPGPDNPRNSEGDFVTLKDTRILFIYSHYTGTSTSDHAPAYLAGRTSSDGGKTWTPKDEVIVEQEGTMNVMSVSLLRLKNGEIALFYLKKNQSVTN